MGTVLDRGDGADLFTLCSGDPGPPLFVIVDQVLFERLASTPFEPRDGEASIMLLRLDQAASSQLRTVQGMAATLVDRIRRAQPFGPYRLAGIQDAGTLAYEVAVQIHAADEAVELGLVDGERLDRPAWRARLDGGAANPLQHALAAYDAPRSPLVLHLLATASGADGGADFGWSGVAAPGTLRLVDAPPSDAADPIAAGLIAMNRAIPRVLSEGAPLRAGSERPEASAGADDNSSVVVIQDVAPGGAVVVCVPGAGATVADFLALALALGPRRRVYGLQARGLDREAAFPHPTVEAAARHHFRALRSHSGLPERVHLVGHSFGGWVAFELALNLQDAGCEVGSLTLLDSACPDLDERPPRECTRAEALMELVALYEEHAARPLGVDAHRLQALDPDAQVAWVHRRALEAGVMPAGSSPSTLLGPLSALEAALRTSYRPRRAFEGPATLVFVPDGQETWDAAMRRFSGAVAGWRPYAPRLRARQGEGTHTTILRSPNVASWAGCIDV
jgi:arthrofactin-type cyclic lipopeptide synthetase C